MVMDLTDHRGWNECKGGFCNDIPFHDLLPDFWESGNSSSTTDDVDMSDVDGLMSTAMKNLSVEDRDQALNDVHGVPEVKEEDEASMDVLLQQLNSILQQKKEDKRAGAESFILAELQDRSYVSNRAFRMSFLRADDYNPSAAAERMLKYFNLKRDAFGYEKMTSAITLDDLETGALAILKSGAYQVSPVPDRSGRLVFVSYPGLESNHHSERTALQAHSYMMMALTESMNVQRRGLVAVAYCDNLTKNTGRVARKDIAASLPYRLASVHCCLLEQNNFFATQYLTGALRVFQKFTQARFRIHKGTPTECLYTLTSFGIPRGAIAVSLEGEIGIETSQAWLQDRARIESLRRGAQFQGSSTENTSEELARLGVTDNDVLFGKYQTSVDHVGTGKFRDLIDRYSATYCTSAKQEKTSIAEQMVQLIKESNGRFLRFDEVSNQWQAVHDSEARKKTAHTFRNRKGKSRRPAAVQVQS